MPKLPRAVLAFWNKVRPKTVLGRMYLYTTPWGIPFYGYVYWGETYLHSGRVFVLGTWLFIVLNVLCVAGGSYLTTLTVKWFPEPQQAPQRVGTNLLLLVLFIVVGTRQTMWLMDAVHLFGYHYRPRQDFWVLVSVAVVYVLIAALGEVVYTVSQWQSTQLEAQQLAKQQVQAQLDEVKQQVNPHFLFNSLNSLSVLIGEDPKQAERFVDEMAKVYRYLLQAHRTTQLTTPAGLTTLDAELRFLQSYAYLLRTRYGAGIELTIQAAEADRTSGLLPLTLQTLVDNAIRHNVVSTAKPLRIDIQTTSAGLLRVRNTRQKRSVRVPINREGLSTLQSRYHLLTGPDRIRVEADEQQFSVSVQLVPL
ncbi:sensor histidine kinase [Hymenobacter crusticola]|uniref:Signal transduction histidine kinase internal region domain-containing protein n=1 Tax=Hymenobacter crusticola TaxID=1770526 RepID=A0A243WFZ9_9BACT|nr:sensor histidine kinase [Hymenobacter crusticola]OUJ74674.1 hypothetical protein BXP70_07875 [Hymenobacter crusticola]